MNLTKVNFVEWLVNKFASFQTKLNNSVEKQEFAKLNEKVDYISNGIFKDIVLEDSVTSDKYVVEINNGVISTRLLPNTLLVNESTKTEFYDGDFVNLQDIILSLSYSNGQNEEIDDYSRLHISPSIVTKNDTELKISYLYKGAELLTTLLPINVVDFDPAVKLIDFNYTDNQDGSYTITGWKQTLNGESSTEIIIPNNIHIKL